MPEAVGHTDAIVDEIVRAIAPGATITRRPFVYATSSRLEEIDVTDAGGKTLRLVAKHLGRDAMTEAARQVKPAELDCPGRELAVYRHVLASAGLGTPALVSGWNDDDGGALVIERVEGSPLTEIGDFTTWEAAARWLARMHAMFTAAPPRIPEMPFSFAPPAPLVRYDRELLEVTGARGLRRAASQALGPPELIVALEARHEYALRALASANRTLVHGDFYASNVVVAGDRIAVVDWELAGTGPGALDLAALAAGGWSDEQRYDLMRAYHREAAEAAGPTESFTALVRRVELASLHLALRWVGSATGWEAPAEHRRDWFAAAVAALTRLDRGVP